eukprot:2360140-Lingulodinium_polyedra.AAC.1
MKLRAWRPVHGDEAGGPQTQRCHRGAGGGRRGPRARPARGSRGRAAAAPLAHPGRQALLLGH